jgi:hypothetical protein
MGDKKIAPTDSNEWVVYSPPKSTAFGHVARVRNARKSWPLVQKFLSDWTRFESGNRISLVVRRAPSGAIGRVDEHVASERLKDARNLFGQETSAPGVFPGWSLTEEQLPKAIEFALDDDKYPSQETEPSWLAFHFYFTWKTFGPMPTATRDVEYRKDQSNLGIIIGGGKVFLQPHFVFASPWDSDRTIEFLDRLDVASPFRFRDQYFSRVLPPKGKGSRYGRVYKLPKGWRGSGAVQ